MNFIAYTVKGLESIAEEEIKATIPGVKVQEVNAKRILFESELVPELTKLRCVDDIAILLLRTQVETQADVLEKIATIDFASAREQLTELRKFEDKVSITLSINKNAEIKEDLEAKLAEVLVAKSGLEYEEGKHENFDIRVFVDEDELLCSLRLTSKPLFHRAYRELSVKGSLRPTITAALVRMTSQGQAGKLVDNFCGSGSILAEGLLAGLEVAGGDIDPLAVEASVHNLKSMGYKTQGKIYQSDAAHSPFSPDEFDFAVSNLPWNQQIKVGSISDLYLHALREYRRIVKPNGKICLLVGRPELVSKHAKLLMPDRAISIHKIGLLGQTPSIVMIG